MPTFAELGVTPALVRALATLEITEPTPIQAAALPVLLARGDAYLHSETGTGKTLAYLLPIFCRIDASLDAPQAMVVAPTHELAVQIQRHGLELAQHAGLPIRIALLMGGSSMERQVEKLKRKPQIVVGTPGRILDLVELRKLKLQRLATVVIDEADGQLTGDTRRAVTAIVERAPRERQLVCASATEEPETTAVFAAWAPSLVVVRASAAPVSPNIAHRYLVCGARDKAEILRRLLRVLRPKRAMVFVHHAATAERVATHLAKNRVHAVDLHGVHHKQERAAAMTAFRAAKVPVLIVSDVAARGLDIRGITHVFNLDVPTRSKAYLHRVGRTGRAGASGEALTIMSPAEVGLVRRYERELGITMQHVRLDDDGRVLPAA